MISIKNRKMLIPNEERYIGTTFDDNSEVRTFKISRYTQTDIDLSAFTAKADIFHCDTETTDRADLEMEVQAKYILLHLYITKGMVTTPGTRLIDLKLFNDDGEVKWSSYKGAFYVEDPFTTPQATQENLTELEQLEARINRAIATAYDKAAKVVGDWLDENIGEIEGYVIDKSLTVENAAADAKSVGLRLDQKKDKTWYRLHRFSAFGGVLQFALPVWKSYPEDITYDTKRNLFYVGTNDVSGGGYKSQIVAINANSCEIVATYNYTWGTIGNLSYNPETDQIYVSLTGSGGYRLHYIDAATMEYKGLLSDKVFSVGVQYDIESGLNVALQLQSGGAAVAEIRIYDEDFNEIDTYTVSIDPTDTPQQGFAVKGGILYVPTWHSVLEIDYLNGQVNRISLAEFAKGTIEPEGFCFIDDDLYMLSNSDGGLGFGKIWKYGHKSAYNAEVEQIYDTKFVNIKDVYSTYPTLAEYVRSLPGFTKVYLYSYNPTDIFTDLPTIPDASTAVGIIYQISVIIPYFDPVYMQIELEINRIGANENRRRWRGVFKNQDAEAITWYTYATDAVQESITDAYAKHTSLFDYINAMPIGGTAYLYVYYDVGVSLFTDMPTLGEYGVIYEISIKRPRLDIAFTEIEMEAHRTKGNLWRRWRGTIKLSTSTEITWHKYAAEDALDVPTSAVGTIQYFHGVSTGSMVSVSFHLSLASAQTKNTTIVTGLPAQWATNTPIEAWDNQNGVAVPVTIGANGDLTLRSDTAANASLRFNFTYLTKLT